MVNEMDGSGVKPPRADDDRGLILIVDDDAAVCWSLEQALQSEGHRTQVAADAGAAKRQLRKERPDCVLTDIRMPGGSGLELLAELKNLYPSLPVIVMTAHGTMETAIQAVQQGAFDYLPKPIALDRLRSVVGNALGERRLAAVSSRGELPAALDMAIIGSTPAMQEVYRRIAAAAASDIGVLITGPTGSGKELVARALHRHSQRSHGPFIAVNCGALPDHLVESELFGHEVGAFTDAKQAKQGRIEAADGGVLFLDEVGELPLPTQVKLLRFLEDQRLLRVGGEEERQVNVRIIAATNRNLTSAIAAGEFREDLSYRLRVLTIELPPLRDRLDDVPDLIGFFLNRIADRLQRRLSITEEAMALLRAHSWPGNVRELRHVIEEAGVLATGGVIGAEHLSLNSNGQGGSPAMSLEQSLSMVAQRLFNQAPGAVHATVLERVELHLIREAMARTQGNQLRAAELLGINRITLKKRLDQAEAGKADGGAQT
ncbi:MAG: sigma-54-dependent Fis family transcriptional regulator [Planctomycetota bacterium]|nr:MAG: sigma-54-dependent Fis family transcriptional regulator [Planctomycetota bacterium]